MWVDKDGEFYNRSMKSYFQNNDREIQRIRKENQLLRKDSLKP